MKSNQGQILAEFAIAMAVLAIGIVSTVVVLNKAIATIEKVKELQAAVFLTTEEMELIKNIKYPYPDDPADSDQYNNIVTRSLSGLNRAGYTFDLERTVVNSLDAANNQVRKRVEIKVIRSNSSQPIIIYRTYLTKNGI